MTMHPTYMTREEALVELLILLPDLSNEEIAEILTKHGNGLNGLPVEIME